MCDEAVRTEPRSLAYVPDRFKTEEMCNKIISTMPNAFHRIPYRFKTQEMSINAVEVDPRQLKDLPDHFKTQGMCDKAARDYIFSLQFVPNWFVIREQIETWYDDDYAYNDNGMID